MTVGVGVGVGVAVAVGVAVGVVVGVAVGVGVELGVGVAVAGYTGGVTMEGLETRPTTFPRVADALPTSTNTASVDTNTTSNAAVSRLSARSGVSTDKNNGWTPTR